MSEYRKFTDKLTSIVGIVLALLLLVGGFLIVDYAIKTFVQNKYQKEDSVFSQDYEEGWDDGYDLGYAAALDWEVSVAIDELKEDIKAKYGIYPSKALSLLNRYVHGEFQDELFKNDIENAIIVAQEYYDGVEKIIRNAKEKADEIYSND